MVDNITSLTGNGLKDWFIQRVTAVYFAGYVLFLLGYIFSHLQLTYHEWHQLFACGLFKIATVIAILTILTHTWIGIWTVTTDYIKCYRLRITIQVAVCIWLLSLFLWVLMIVWGQ